MWRSSVGVLRSSAAQAAAAHASRLQPAAPRALCATPAAPHAGYAARRQGGSAPQRSAALSVRAFTSSPQAAAPAGASRVYTDFKLYKGKAAVAFKVIRPEWVARPDGTLAKEREGVLLLEFAPAQAAPGAPQGERRYDWEHKQTFALSAVELGALVANDGTSEASFYHDPNKGSNNEGVTNKTLKLAPMSQPGAARPSGDRYLSLAVRDAVAGNNQLGLPITPGEMVVIKTLSNYVIPYLLGFDELWHAPPTVSSDTSQRLAADSAPPF